MNIKKLLKGIDKTVVFSALIIILITVPIIISASYSFLQADDFSHANGVGVFGGNVIELFIASLKYAKGMFETWQGTYTSMFLQAFLSPLNGLGNIQLRVVMIVNVLLFIASLIILICAVCRYCHMSKVETSILLIVCMIGIFCFNAWTQVFNWFSGAVSYSYPLSLCFLGIGAALSVKSKKGAILTATLMFAASGGSLVVGGAGCSILLAVCVIKKMAGITERKDYITLVIAVIGALINALAPGNYIRHTAIDSSGIHFKNALAAAVYESVDIVENLLYNTPFLVFILVVLAIGIRMGGKSSVHRKCLFAAIFFSVITLVAACFPICLGYSGREWIPNRAKFVETVVAVIALITVTIAIGRILGQKLNQFCEKELLFILIIILTIIPNVNSQWRISALVPYKMWGQVVTHSYENYYQSVNDIYNMIKTDSNQDVFVYKLPGGGIEFFPKMDLSEDMAWWVNAEIAQYYGKNSVQCVSSNVYDYGNGEKNIRIYPEMFEESLDYVSIYKKNSATQELQIVQELQPFDTNLVISTHSGESGEIIVNIYEDEAGTIQMGEHSIEY